ncbi:MAG: hypothetical protein JNL69_05750 [Bacteroidia bacterium]|nr:hypothetical protein [Bacteroidia bacterium]
MNLSKLITLSFFIVIASACKTTKKNTISTVESAPSVSETANTTFPFMLNTVDYIVPGNDELIAIQKQYTDVTLEQLKQGHEIYTKGACINCHGPQSIKRFSTEQWKIIMNDMAERSSLTKEQKDAVYTYVLAIKAK